MSEEAVVIGVADEGFLVVECIPVESIQIAPSSRASRYLSTRISDVQEKNKAWCLAYATAAIMTYKGTSKTGRGIMEEVYGANVSDSQAFKRNDFMSYAKRYGFNIFEVIYYHSTSNYATLYSRIVSEINAGRPMLLGMKSYPNGKLVYHSLVARGYEDVKGTTSVWNPWYPYYETVTNLQNYVAAEDKDKDIWQVGEYYYNWK